MTQLQQVNETLNGRHQLMAPSENLIFDIDATNSPTYGEQYGAAFNTHYGVNGYHPMFMFDGLTGDSGFSVPELFELAEAYLNQIPKEILESTQFFYREFDYQAKSGTRKRRVIAKIERPADELLFRFTYIITMLSLSPENIAIIYLNRETMERFIKEGKLGFAFGQITSTEFECNAFKLQFAILAYNLHNGLRRI